ncbi:glycoside hydrolase family 36 protein [Arthrobacter sp. W4I7]|uniref:glycoside hydrolase family 36 protein n=1 Tax=Arthrobacter sp. W4I7 TaxID=3042296 RepID=UPI00278B4D05|nr:glycoside hydrolase family 36 protein [Arthrobacter sp. W4I7]MDQ0691183.1 alpha-galactosidase [Arthrobacter sp. W4I7]
MENNSYIEWSNGTLHVALRMGRDSPVGVAYLHPAEAPPAPLASGPALVEILTVEEGRARTSQRYAESTVGKRLRYVSHAAASEGSWNILTVLQRDTETGLEARTVLRAADGASTVQAVTTVRNTGLKRVALQAVTTLALPLLAGHQPAEATSLQLASATSQWLGENQWTLKDLRRSLPDLNLGLHEQDQRGHLLRASTSSWSTGGPLPTAALVDADDQWCWMWQVEHNGGWAWELSETRDALGLALLGPTDDQHNWLHSLEPGDEFTTVPAALAISRDGLQGALAQMTAHRRALRGPIFSGRPPVIYNDFMNTLMGDPSTERLLPLVAAAADAGADIFCIDAGWYDDTTDWWDAVGEWQPSTARFPNGLSEVTDAISSAGMGVGLWLEPEVVGVRSPMAVSLPKEAFLQRRGVRVVEHGRYHLDFRHPAARAHLDETVDRLVEDFSTVYFKLDYNITAGTGTDLGTSSSGAGLLGHNRAYLDWLDGVKARHPQVIIENCASGAMRQDYALLARLDLQSTSDQQDPLLYPPIAANAFLSVLPEQAANWAYPQPEMDDEEIRFTMATGMLGRMCLSGFLDRMTTSQLALVSEAVSAHKEILPEIQTSTAFYPSGIPLWNDQWLSVGLRAPARDLVTVWQRGHAQNELPLHLPRWAGQEITVLWLGSGKGFETKWDPSGYLFLSATSGTGHPYAATFTVQAA